MRMIPYIVAAVVSAAVLAAGAGFCWQTRRAMLANMRQAAIDAPDLSAKQKREVRKKIDAGQPADIGIEVTESMMLRVQVSKIFAAYWHLWGMTVVLVCFGVALLYVSVTSPDEVPAIESPRRGGEQP